MLRRGAKTFTLNDLCGRKHGTTSRMRFLSQVRISSSKNHSNPFLILDDWTPDYWHPINEHILESLVKNSEEEAKINAERAEAGYAARFVDFQKFS